MSVTTRASPASRTRVPTSRRTALTCSWMSIMARLSRGVGSAGGGVVRPLRHRGVVQGGAEPVEVPAPAGFDVRRRQATDDALLEEQDGAAVLLAQRHGDAPGRPLALGDVEDEPARRVALHDRHGHGWGDLAAGVDLTGHRE